MLEVNPARLAHRALRLQGLLAAARQGRGALHGRPLAGGAGVHAEIVPPYYSVKEAVFPFVKFPGVDTILGPEMKSTGEVMGVGRTFAEAFVKVSSPPAPICRLPARSSSACALRPQGRRRGRPGAARARFHHCRHPRHRRRDRGCRHPGLDGEQGQRGPSEHCGHDQNQEICMVINTVDEKRQAITDSRSIRTSALAAKITIYTTIEGARRMHGHASPVGPRRLFRAVAALGTEVELFMIKTPLTLKGPSCCARNSIA